MTDRSFPAALQEEFAISAREWAMQRGTVENYPATARTHIRQLADGLLSQLRAAAANAQPVAKLRFGNGDGMPSILSWNSRPAGTYFVYDAPVSRQASAPAAGEPLTAEDVERQYHEGVHIGSGLPRATCPCGFCVKHRHGFKRGDGLVVPQANEAVSNAAQTVEDLAANPPGSGYRVLRNALLSLKEAVEFTPLGIRGLKAVQRANDALASAPESKPIRAPLNDWRVRAIAECLETEWDEMSPDLAEANARIIVGYLIDYEKESERIEAANADGPVEPVVQAVRGLQVKVPEVVEPLDADIWRIAQMPECHHGGDVAHSVDPIPFARALLARYASASAGEADALRQAIKTCGSKVFKALAAIANVHTPDDLDRLGAIPRSPVFDEVVRIRQAIDECGNDRSPRRDGRG